MIVPLLPEEERDVRKLSERVNALIQEHNCVCAALLLPAYVHAVPFQELEDRSPYEVHFGVNTLIPLRTRPDEKEAGEKTWYNQGAGGVDPSDAGMIIWHGLPPTVGERLGRGIRDAWTWLSSRPRREERCVSPDTTPHATEGATSVREHNAGA